MRTQEITMSNCTDCNHAIQETEEYACETCKSSPLCEGCYEDGHTEGCEPEADTDAGTCPDCGAATTATGSCAVPCGA